MQSLLLLFLISGAFANEWVKGLKLPPGFTLEKVISVPGARQMTRAPSGRLYVGTMDQGKVYAVSPDGKVTTIFEGLNYPQGVLFEGNDLYVSQIQGISKVIDVEKNLTAPKLTPVKMDFPNNRWHGWKTIAKGPDGKLWVPVGAPCNVCEEKFPFSALHRMDFDGKNFETMATGIRNTVGYTWHPETKELYFTEMGRDMMGDDLPPDEINVLKEKGQHFGFPYLHAGKYPDPQFGKKLPKGLKTTPPIYDVPAHSSPIGIAFFPKEKYPKEFHDCFLVAEHGSWNRTKKSGHKVMKACLKNGKVTSYEDFITGFKEGEKVFGRPVHFLFISDGSFYLSEDEPGTILHLRLKK